jgi:hypothetical protein
MHELVGRPTYNIFDRAHSDPQRGAHRTVEDKKVDEEEDDIEDERKMAAVEEAMPVVQKILPLALVIVNVPVKTSDLLSALPDLTAVPPDNVTQSNAEQWLIAIKPSVLQTCSSV